MKRFVVLTSVLLTLYCETPKQGLLDNNIFYHKYYRIFSFHTQDFDEEIKYDSSIKFCYKVYYLKNHHKRYAFEFINEKSNIEYRGFFNKNGMLKKINVFDSSRGRMNMEFFYSNIDKLKSIKLLDDNKKIFAFGKVEKSKGEKVLFLKFKQVETNKPVLYYIIRGNGKGRDLEIATYSTDGTLFSNHLYFYNKKNQLAKYEFYKKLNFIFGIEFVNGRVDYIYNERDNNENYYDEKDNY